MGKNFSKWHFQKSAIDAIQERPLFHEGEIWFCSVGMNVGFEQDGGGDEFIRPVIIFKKFNRELFWAIPLTTGLKEKRKNSRYYYVFSFMKDVVSLAILSQLKSLDARRLKRKIGSVNSDDLLQIQNRLRNLLF